MAAIEIDPESELKFVLSHNEATPRCILTLRHPGNTTDSLAFKVSDSFSTAGYGWMVFQSTLLSHPLSVLVGEDNSAASVSRTTQSRVACPDGFGTDFHPLGGQG